MYQYNFCPVCGKNLSEDIIDHKVRKYCTSCGFVHYLNPRSSVGAVAVRDGKILLVKRGVEPGKGLWSPPSGFIDPGETAEQACLRELEEETGLTGRIVELLGVYTQDARVYGPVLIVMYLVENLLGELKAADDAVDVRFIEIDDAIDFSFECFNKALKKAKENLGL